MPRGVSVSLSPMMISVVNASTRHQTPSMISVVNTAAANQHAFPHSRSSGGIQKSLSEKAQLPPLAVALLNAAASSAALAAAVV
ncbi:hypothetical protein PLESTM_000891700 [Pleodorina starrii]|nr:hypothetical protein PLESTM_000891700 [Pleodorina starrii]